MFATIAIPIILAGYLTMAVVIIRDTIRKRRDEAEGYGIEPDPWLAGMARHCTDDLRTFSEKTIIPQHPRHVGTKG